MDTIFSILGYVIKDLVVTFLFFWPGWLALRIITFGKFPKLKKPSKHVEDYYDVLAISFFGMFVTLVVLAVAVKLFSS